jgi:membrane fusion protein (multidrug efflux system)
VEPSKSFGVSTDLLQPISMKVLPIMDALTPDRSLTKTGEHAPVKSGVVDKPARETARKKSDSPDENPGASENLASSAKSDSAPEPKVSLRDRMRKNPKLVILAALGIVIVLIACLIWWLIGRQYESTDDAFIGAHSVAISSQVSGTVSELLVNDNQKVKAGDVIARLDPAIYKAQLDQAKANVENLDAQISEQKSQIDLSNGQVTEAQAALKFSQQENARYADLLQTGAGTQQRAQQASSDLTQKQAALASAQASAVAATRQLKVLQAQRDAAAANQELAQKNLDYTVITAPVDGRVTMLSGAKGTYIQPGQSITMFVPNDIWITANFKETQLDHMRVGQPVDISIDAFPDQTFKGHVNSIQPGSGTAFSLLPAENATGNYIKVVQRVPVKITFDKIPDEVTLGPGISVVPTVKVR